MAALPVTNPTMLDWIKALSPTGGIDVVAEILNETNEILDDVTYLEGNLTLGHRTTIRTGIPAPTWRVLYGGVQPTKSTRAQVTDTTGMLEAYAEIDKALADLNGNTAEFRLSEDRAHIEGISQELAETFFNGNTATNPERFLGLAPRFNSLSAENADNIIDAGGTGSDNASIWLVGWSPNTVHGIFPKGSMAGIQSRDLGEVTIENVDGANGRMQAYRSHYRVDAGLTVRDWRYVVRICNIDRSTLLADASSGANLHELTFQATELIPNLSGGARFAFYMDRDVRTKVRQQSALLTKNSTLGYADVGGRRTQMLHDIPMRRVDALSSDEARVV